MDADQQGGRLRKVLPAFELHPEPVVHERVPEVLLPLEEIPVGPVQGPLSCTVGDPPGGTGLLLAPCGDLRLRLLRLSLRLALAAPVTRRSPSTPAILLWAPPFALALHLKL